MVPVEDSFHLYDLRVEWQFSSRAAGVQAVTVGRSERSQSVMNI